MSHAKPVVPRPVSRGCGQAHLRPYVAALLISVIGGLSGLAWANADLPAPAAHRTEHGFRNPVDGAQPRTLGELLRWRWNAMLGQLPPAPQTQTPTVAADLAYIQAYQRSGPGSTAARSASLPALTWIGHATALVQAGGLNVLTDPVFSERASPMQFFGPRRAQAPGVALSALPPIDVVVISHNHYDHLDRDSIVGLEAKARREGGSTLYLVPLGHKAWFENLGVSQVIELDWWQKHTVRGVDFYLTPSQHWSARGVLDHNDALWGSWAVFAEDLQWYFAGDSGYSGDFADIRTRFGQRQTPALGGGFDLALIPIGAYAPRWFMRAHHINPEEAVQVHQDLQAKFSVGVHWGTFALSDEALDQPPMDLAAARAAAGLADQDFTVLKIGETRILAARAAS